MVIIIYISKCEVDGCNNTNENTTINYNKALKMDLCAKHRTQYNLNGKFSEITRFDKNKVVENEDYIELIIVNRDLIEVARVKIDKEDKDRCILYKWCINNKGLVCNSKVGTLGAYIMKCNRTGKRVKFINRDKLDCRKQNLVIDESYIQKKRRQRNKKNIKKKKRTRYTPNKIIEYDGYAMMILYNHKQEEIARTKIDKEDIEKCIKLKWSYKKSKKDTENKKYGYATSKINGKYIALHRYILDYNDKKVVDHINNDTLDNRKINLRIITIAENNRNRSIRSSDSLHIMGSSKCKENNSMFDTYITVMGRQIRLGRYNREESIKLRLNAEKIYGFMSQKNLFEKYGIKADEYLLPISEKRILVLDRYKSRLNSANSHSRIQGLLGDLKLEEYIQILQMFTDEHDDLKCAYCDEILDDDNNVIEHVVASANGGGTTLGNVVISCNDCNRSKLDYDFKEWYTRQLFYSEEKFKLILDYVYNPSKYINSKVIYLDIILNREKNKYFKFIDEKCDIYYSDRRKEIAEKIGISSVTIGNILNKRHYPRYNYNFVYPESDELKSYFEDNGYDVKYLPNKYSQVVKLDI